MIEKVPIDPADLFEIGSPVSAKMKKEIRFQAWKLPEYPTVSNNMIRVGKGKVIGFDLHWHRVANIKFLSKYRGKGWKCEDPIRPFDELPFLKVLQPLAVMIALSQNSTTQGESNG